MGQTLLKCFHSQQEQQQKLPIKRLFPLEKEESLLSNTIPLSFFTQLPLELLIYEILPHLNYRDLCHLSQTNRYFNNLIETQIDHLWINCIKDEMLDILFEEKINVTYSKLNKTVEISICPNDLVTEVYRKIYYAFDELPELSPDKYQFFNQLDDTLGNSNLYTRFIDCCKIYNDTKDITLLIEQKQNGIHAIIVNSIVRYDQLKFTVDKFDPLTQQTIIRNEKYIFQYLFRRRQQKTNPYTMVYTQTGICTSITPFTFALFHRHITVHPFTDSIKPEKRGYVLIVHYRNGLLQNEYQLDKQSLSLVTESFHEWLGPNEESWRDYKYWWPELRIKIYCVKCQTKLDYTQIDCNTTSNARHLQIYNWYKSYPRRKVWRRFEYIEIYCKLCERYSVWKTVYHLNY